MSDPGQPGAGSAAEKRRRVSHDRRGCRRTRPSGACAAVLGNEVPAAQARETQRRPALLPAGRHPAAAPDPAMALSGRIHDPRRAAAAGEPRRRLVAVERGPRHRRPVRGGVPGADAAAIVGAEMASEVGRRGNRPVHGRRTVGPAAQAGISRSRDDGPNSKRSAASCGKPAPCSTRCCGHLSPHQIDDEDRFGIRRLFCEEHAGSGHKASHLLMDLWRR